MPDSPGWLWIAFRFCIFDLEPQHRVGGDVVFQRCELLSDFVSLTLSHNFRSHTWVVRMLWIAFRFCIFDLEPQQQYSCPRRWQVVNCFQILYLWPWATTSFKFLDGGECCELLSDFVSLTLSHNLPALALPGLPGCELLSDFVSLTLSHNYWRWHSIHQSVVNCFQILYLWPWATTSKDTRQNVRQLWIAFRFCIFDLEPQRNANS